MSEFPHLPLLWGHWLWLCRFWPQSRSIPACSGHCWCPSPPPFAPPWCCGLAHWHARGQGPRSPSSSPSTEAECHTVPSRLQGWRSSCSWSAWCRLGFAGASLGCRWRRWACPPGRRRRSWTMDMWLGSSQHLPVAHLGKGPIEALCHSLCRPERLALRPQKMP